MNLSNHGVHRTAATARPFACPGNIQREVSCRARFSGGGPALYVRPDHFKKQDWTSDVKALTTPFWPSYRPDDLKTDEHLSGKTIDYSHEREWRVPHDFTFDRKRVPFVILDTYEDMA